MSLPTAVLDHQTQIKQLTKKTQIQLLKRWLTVSALNISASWDEQLPDALDTFESAQYDAALAGGLYGPTVLAQQGSYTPPQYFTNPHAMVGYASSGAPAQIVLTRPVSYAKQLIGNGAPAGLALEKAGMLLTSIVRTQIPDVARVSAGLDVAARPGTGYTRMVGSSACDRCVVLAGRFYRWNTGFLRHPRCNCVHVPTNAKSTQGALAEGLIDDPYKVFNALSEAEQNRIYGVDNAQAIRDGADIYQVVNARRGRRGLTTSEGTTRRGYSRDLAGTRLTPEGIYRQNLSRDKTLELLRENNYILPAGQVPGGSIRKNDTEGFGALGRGGTRVGARTAVLEARRTGVRDSSSRYTMTEAERRLADSRARYDAILQGRNPFDSKGEGLTPAIAAQVEVDYRRWLASGGQVFTA